jgi:hypothetical protein
VSLQHKKIANWIGAEIASIIKNAAAGRNAPTDNGTNKRRVQQPCSGSGSEAAFKGTED